MTHNIGSRGRGESRAVARQRKAGHFLQVLAEEALLMCLQLLQHHMSSAGEGEGK